MAGGLLSGQTCTADEMNGFIRGKHQGGIRYSGNFPDYGRIGVVIGGGADAIYSDEQVEDTILYVGEGQRGDQKLTFGNRALAWAFFHELPVHVFVRNGRDRYSYRGAHLIGSIRCGMAPDCTGRQRGVFRFELLRSELKAMHMSTTLRSS
ncbi:MAG: hypothetical protein JXA57_08275 [Armatimonadetes bacterium]|nr:hypothetical protein [Armatimonadota bacterium]